MSMEDKCCQIDSRQEALRSPKQCGQMTRRDLRLAIQRVVGRPMKFRCNLRAIAFLRTGWTGEPGCQWASWRVVCSNDCDAGRWIMAPPFSDCEILCFSSLFPFPAFAIVWVEERSSLDGIGEGGRSSSVAAALSPFFSPCAALLSRGQPSAQRSIGDLCLLRGWPVFLSSPLYTFA